MRIFILCFGLAIVARTTCPSTVSAQVLYPMEGPPPTQPKDYYIRRPQGLIIDSFVTGLEVVWDLLFLPDGRLLVSERVGRVRLVTSSGHLQTKPWAIPPQVDTTWVNGVLGLALHPSYPAQPWVYLMYTMKTDSGPKNRVVKFRDQGTHGDDMQVLIDGLPAFSSNSGGRIRFGPDGMLYVGVGDAGKFEEAQNLGNLYGKILRVTPDGTIPPDNPWPNNPIWAFGFKNPLGLAFNPVTQALFVADAGPIGRDQVEVVRRGSNHGWPLVVGKQDIPGIVNPVLEWTQSTPPGSLLFFSSPKKSSFEGDLFLTTLRSEALIRIRFEDRTNPHQPTSIERWFVSEDSSRSGNARVASEFGRLRGIALGRDGALYVGTSNRDQSFRSMQLGADRILRIYLPNAK